MHAATNRTFTANGALTNSTTYDACLDFFSVAGEPRQNLNAFIEAFNEDAQLAMRILFWSRDCRGGAGAKFNFQLCMNWLQENKPKEFDKVAMFIPAFGYWKDIFKHLEPDMALIHLAKSALDAGDGLCAKYCPRKGRWFYELRKVYNLSPAEFRHKIVSMTKVVETLMCQNRWNEIEYSGVPSVAGKMYSKTFFAHDGERYLEYIDDVNAGKAKINSSVLFPSDIYRGMMNRDSEDVVNALWSGLPDYMGGNKERILPVCDTSGSMMGIPMDNSIALGVYIAERSKGLFHNTLMTFEDTPHVVMFEDSETAADKLKKMNRLRSDCGTNLQAVFDLLLKTAVKNGISEDEMPTKILIFSDMEFNFCGGRTTNFSLIQKKYKQAGYKTPGIIFWNINGRANNQPATKYDHDVALASGYSPSIVKSVLGGEALDPISIMLKTVNAERYSCIVL